MIGFPKACRSSEWEYTRTKNSITIVWRKGVMLEGIVKKGVA